MNEVAIDWLACVPFRSRCRQGPDRMVVQPAENGAELVCGRHRSVGVACELDSAIADLTGATR